MTAEAIEIVLIEEDFENEAQLCAHVAETLAAQGAIPTSILSSGALPADALSSGGLPADALPTDTLPASDLPTDTASVNPTCLADLTGAFAHLTQPARLVLKHSALDPVREAEDLHAITDISHEMPANAIWFDVLSAALLEAESSYELLDVIVYYDDLDEDEANSEPTDGPISATEALELLRQGNLEYLGAREDDRNISRERIHELFEGGQQPYAVVIACSDSRVVPEHIFMAGLGELFVIRVAGNIIGASELASAVYGCEHLHSKLLLVLGHTHCGAIEAAMAGEAYGPVAAITSRIAEVIASERDPYVASVLNVRAAIEELSACDEIAHLIMHEGLEIHGAIYHTHSGVVDFL